MQLAFKSTRLFFGLLLILVFIVSCQGNQEGSPDSESSPADTTAIPSPADTTTPADTTISLIVSARIKVPKLEIDSVRNYTVEVKKVKVKVNPIGSAKNFMTNNWQNLFPIVFGSGSIASILGWIIAKRKESKQGSSKLTDNQENVSNKEAADEE